MQRGLVVDLGGGDGGGVGVGALEGGELIGDGGGDDLGLLEPAELAFVGADLVDAATGGEDVEALAVGDGGGALADGGDAVAEVGLLGADVDDADGAGLAVRASGEEREGEQERRARGRSGLARGDEVT